MAAVKETVDEKRRGESVRALKEGGERETQRTEEHSSADEIESVSEDGRQDDGHDLSERGLQRRRETRLVQTEPKTFCTFRTYSITGGLLSRITSDGYDISQIGRVGADGRC